MTDMASPATSGSEEFVKLLPKNQVFVVKTSIKPIVLILRRNHVKKKETSC